MMPVSAFWVLINQDAIFVQNDMTTLLSLSPGKLAADIEGFFCAESKMAFQKSISMCL